VYVEGWILGTSLDASYAGNSTEAGSFRAVSPSCCSRTRLAAAETPKVTIIVTAPISPCSGPAS
jgi:hypothetical protein